MPEQPDVMRAERAKAQRRAEYHFSPRAGDDKWRRLSQYARSPEFVAAIKEHPQADKKVQIHIDSLHALSRAPVIGKVDSSQGHGKFYEIRQLPDGQLGCTCQDWRFRGSMNPKHECRHIKAHKEGMAKHAAFAARTKAFFDELSKILSSQRTKKEEGYDKHTGRPFSSALTQADEPLDYRPLNPPPDEPDVIMRGYP